MSLTSHDLGAQPFLTTIRYGIRLPSGGYAAIYLDGKKVARASFYAATVARRRVYVSGPLKAGTHTISIRPLGTKPAASRNSWVAIDNLVAGGTSMQETSLEHRFRRVSTTSAYGGSYDTMIQAPATDTTPAQVQLTLVRNRHEGVRHEDVCLRPSPVYIDGVLKTTLDLRSASTVYKALVYSTTSASVSTRSASRRSAPAPEPGPSSTWIASPSTDRRQVPDVLDRLIHSCRATLVRPENVPSSEGRRRDPAAFVSLDRPLPTLLVVTTVVATEPLLPGRPNRRVRRHPVRSRTWASYRQAAATRSRPDRRAREDPPMARIRRFDHVGITVADLDTVMAFFVGLGLEVEGRMLMEGEFVDTVIGIPDSRSEIVMLVLPDGGTKLELSSFIRPDHEPGSPLAMSNELGLRNIAFEVDDLQAIVDRLAADGYSLVGGIGQYEDMWRMAYVRGPEGIIVSLAQRID